MFRLPATRRDFWALKIDANRARDQSVAAELRAAGWRVLTVWECSLRGRRRQKFEEVLGAAAHFIAGIDRTQEIAGT
jgi:DNA mismatch endonuclease (patch repair protein)